MSSFTYSIVYNPKLSDNEERSADFFKEFAAEALTSVCSISLCPLQTCLVSVRTSVGMSHINKMITICAKFTCHNTCIFITVPWIFNLIKWGI